jgi:hypothetical protein
VRITENRIYFGIIEDMLASIYPVEGQRARWLGGIMKMRLLFSAFLAMVMIQLAPLAAWSHCYNDGYGYPGPGYGVSVTPWQARQIYRAERAGFGYGGPRPYAYPAYGAYGYPPPGYYHHGFVTNVARAIF